MVNSQLEESKEVEMRKKLGVLAGSKNRLKLYALAMRKMVV